MKASSILLDFPHTPFPPPPPKKKILATPPCAQARVLVTHGIGYLPHCDLIVSLDRGCITEMGMYDELMSNCGEFAEFINVYSNAEENTDEDNDPGNHGKHHHALYTFGLLKLL